MRAKRVALKRTRSVKGEITFSRARLKLNEICPRLSALSRVPSLLRVRTDVYIKLREPASFDARPRPAATLNPRLKLSFHRARNLPPGGGVIALAFPAPRREDTSIRARLVSLPRLYLLRPGVINGLTIDTLRARAQPPHYHIRIVYLAWISRQAPHFRR